MRLKTNRRAFLKNSIISSLSLLLADPKKLPAMGKPLRQPPNILWIIVEDTSSDFAYQGQKLVNTPYVDKLAKEGASFTNAYVTAPVCSPSRSAMITGMYQTTIGAHNHRSSRGTVKYYLPKNIKLLPELFKKAGYYTCNCQIDFKKYAKTDYNFVFDNNQLYDGFDWSSRANGQPFFAQVQLTGGKYRHYTKLFQQIEANLEKPVKPEQVKLPPYYPDHPVIRDDWAKYLNTVQQTDKEVGIILDRLKKENLLDNTIVFFITDHGISHARGKQFLYEEGIHIPFVVWGPEYIKPQKRDELIPHIDMAATSLYFAGIAIPGYAESRPLFGPKAKPREFVISARDRCDETVDRIRSVRKGNFKYIKNFYPARPYLQPCIYKDRKQILITLRQLYKQGKLNKAQSLIMAETRPKEELYDLTTDPYEINNLADNPKYSTTLTDMRKTLQDWIKKTDDKGAYPESLQMYDSDMKVYLDTMRKYHKDEYVQELQANINLMKKWRAQGI